MLNFDFQTLFIIKKICCLTKKNAHKIIVNFHEDHSGQAGQTKFSKSNAHAFQLSVQLS
jgi:hypothetical protein